MNIITQSFIRAFKEYFKPVRIILRKISKLKKKSEKQQPHRQKCFHVTLSQFNSILYDLKKEIEIFIEVYKDEAIASFDKLNLYGEGETWKNALRDLENEMICLYEELIHEPDENLGLEMIKYKTLLKELIKVRKVKQSLIPKTLVEYTKYCDMHKGNCSKCEHTLLCDVNTPQDFSVKQYKALNKLLNLAKEN